MKSIIYLIFLILIVTKQSNCEECAVTTPTPLLNGDAQFMLNYDDTVPEFQLYLTGSGQNVMLMNHNLTSSGVYIGKGEKKFTEYRGNFNVSGYTSERVPLFYFAVETTGLTPNTATCKSIVLSNIDGGEAVKGHASLKLTFNVTETGLSLIVGERTAGYDRVWIRFASTADEHIYGGGEQFTHFNMKGRSFPIWTREQGVGRDKSTNTTFIADTQDGGAGGDYHTTYWPQPIFYSDQLYSAQMTSSKYSILDFAHDDFHEVEVWEDQEFQFDFNIGNSWKDLTRKTAEYLLGEETRPEVAPWSYNGGAILGLQGGTDIVMGLLDQATRNNVKVSGIWIQDWVGQITTSFGTRLFWNWVLDEERYPNIRDIIQEKAAEGIYFTAYINPYLNTLGSLYAEASEKGYLVKTKDGSDHFSDFGEFDAGTVDLTNPVAFDWYKNVIKENLIDVGFRGWMADFGEYLPIEDQIFNDSRNAEELHNLWPSLWAQLNREAIDERNMSGQIFVWMRAGHTGSSKYAMSAWAGDQNVDWSDGDGLVSTIPAALSLGLSGVGNSHFDIGGFTSLYGNTRTQELLLRSAELAVFTPTMRTHEGNRPKENWQIFADDYTFQRFGRLTRLHAMLANYTESLIQEYYSTSAPLQRPMFFEFPDDEKCYDDQISKDQFMFGPDLLVAPIYRNDDEAGGYRQVFFPPGVTWVDIWNSETHIEGGNSVNVQGKMGEPPVFFRLGSEYEDTFKALQSEPAKPYPPDQGAGFRTTATFMTVIVSMVTVLFVHETL